MDAQLVITSAGEPVRTTTERHPDKVLNVEWKHEPYICGETEKHEPHVHRLRNFQSPFSIISNLDPIKRNRLLTLGLY